MEPAASAGECARASRSLLLIGGKSGISFTDQSQSKGRKTQSKQEFLSRVN